MRIVAYGALRSLAAHWVLVPLATLAIGCGGGSSQPGGDAADGRASSDGIDARGAEPMPDTEPAADATDLGGDGAGAADAGDGPASFDAPSAETAPDVGRPDVAADATGADRADAAIVDAPGAETPPPQPPVDLRCATDTIDPLQPEVFLPLGSPAGGAVPLCSGWVVVATQTPPALTYRNVLDGRAGGSISLPAPPGRLVLDFERGTAHVALPSRSSLASVDLQTGTLTEVTVEAKTASVALGNDGLVFVTEQPFSGESGLAVVDAVHGQVLYENKNFSTTGMAFDRAGNQLVTLLSGLTRSTFDATTKMLTKVENPFGTCGAGGNGVVVSGDGKHVLSACPPTTNSPSGGFYDLSLSSLTTVLGQFTGMTGTAAFSPDSNKLAAVGGVSPAPLTVKIADVATHTISSMTAPGFGCTSYSVDGFAWSRGAKMIHMVVNCDTGTSRSSALYAVQAK